METSSHYTIDQINKHGIGYKATVGLKNATSAEVQLIRQACKAKGVKCFHKTFNKEGIELPYNGILIIGGK